MRAKTIKHAEFEILKYLGVEYPENGLTPVPVNEAKDSVVQRRWQTANKNVGAALIKIMSSYTAGLPDGHIHQDWDESDLEAMSGRAHRGELV